MTTKVSALLEKIGYKRIHAGVLAYLIKHSESTARSIEKSCDLRQPEVSLALSYLIDKKWVTTTTIPAPEIDDRRGRPTIMYHLIPVEQVFKAISASIELESRKKMELLTELRAAMMVVKNPVQPESSPKKEQQSNLTPD